MKPYYLLLALLFLSLFTTVTYGEEYGSGIDTTDPQFIKYLTDEYLALVFDVNETNNYNLYLMVGPYENNDTTATSLYIELRDGGLNGYVLETTTINLSSISGVMIVEVFHNITLTNGSYALVITPQGFNEYKFYYIGAYTTTIKPGETYAYYNGWVLLDKDIAYSLKTVDNDVGYPTVTIVSRQIVVDHVEITVELNNWLPNSTVELWAVLVMSTIDKALNEPVTVQVDENGHGVATIELQYSYKEAVVKAKGYDQNGELVVVYSREPVGIDYHPQSFYDTVISWFNTLYEYAYLIFNVVVTILPYAAMFWAVSFASALVKCVQEVSLTPLFDFLHKNYQLLVSLAQLVIKIADKAGDLLKFVGDLILKLILIFSG